MLRTTGFAKNSYRRLKARRNRIRTHQRLSEMNDRLLADMDFSRSLLDEGVRAWPWRKPAVAALPAIEVFPEDRYTRVDQAGTDKKKGTLIAKRFGKLPRTFHIRRPRRKKLISLALQGGGSHGAFTWGVLDRLLEDEQLHIEGISGTSAGAMNAVVLAHGLTTGGRDGARQALTDFWESVADQGSFSLLKSNPTENLGIVQNADPSPMLTAFLGISQFLSPYELNPFDLNPLRHIVTKQIDFERLRTECPIKLFVAATQVRTGKLRLFETKALTADALLASACLPSLHHAIEIEGEAYWDGGYSANPAIFPLLYHCKSRDVVIVLLHPLTRLDHPKTATEIRNRITELSFSTAFLREMRALAHAKSKLEKALFPLGRLERRLRDLNFHTIEAEELMTQLSIGSKLNTHRSFLWALRDQGWHRADTWLKKYHNRIAVRSSVNLTEVFS